MLVAAVGGKGVACDLGHDEAADHRAHRPETHRRGTADLRGEVPHQRRGGYEHDALHEAKAGEQDEVGPLVRGVRHAPQDEARRDDQPVGEVDGIRRVTQGDESRSDRPTAAPLVPDGGEEEQGGPDAEYHGPLGGVDDQSRQGVVGCDRQSDSRPESRGQGGRPGGPAPRPPRQPRHPAPHQELQHERADRVPKIEVLRPSVDQETAPDYQ